MCLRSALFSVFFGLSLSVTALAQPANIYEKLERLRKEYFKVKPAEKTEIAFEICNRLLLIKRKPLRFTKVYDSPGLEVLKMNAQVKSSPSLSFEQLMAEASEQKKQHEIEILPKELQSSSRYAELIKYKAHEAVVLVPMIDQRPICAFDGFIKNAEGVAIANYSLKDTERNPFAAALRAIQKINDYSLYKPWVQFYINAKSRKEVETALWLNSVFNFFGIMPGNIRPTRVVVDIRGDGKLPAIDDTGMLYLQENLMGSNGKTESVIILKGNRGLEITAEAVRPFEFNFTR